MADILKEMRKKLPEGKVSDSCFEASNIIFYTKEKDFFLNDEGKIHALVKEFKKRVELRPDPSICMEMESAEKVIKKLLPKEAGVDNIIFDPQRSQVVLEAEKPGLAIGKNGSILREIKEKAMWVPVVRRTPAIRSQLTEDIRSVLYKHSEDRRKFLDRTGHRIYDGWIRQKKHEWVRISHLGAARQVGRSCLLLQTPESRILIDCGIDPSLPQDNSEAYPYFDAPEFKVDELDAIVISHAHLDHSGLLPYLIKFGYKGPIYCTEPTRDIMSLLQLDMVKIAHHEGKDPLYTSEEVKQVVLQTVTLNFEEVSDVTPDIRLTFYNSGHILGGGMIHINIGNGLHNLLYSGDIKYSKSALLDPAHIKFPRLETMIIEATYGGKDNILLPPKEANKHFCEVIKTTLKRGGKVLCPVLGVGRAQDIMVIIEEMVRNKDLDENISVFLDGMLWDVTAIHTAYPEFLNASIRKQIFHNDANPFLSPIFKRVGSAKERKQVIEESGPCVILATSGMLYGGSAIEYLKAFAGNEKNTLVFSCYQPEGGLGQRILRGEKEFVFGDKGKERVTLNMEINRVEVSDHADRKELMDFVSRVNPKPRKVIVNHGEIGRCLDLASSIHKKLGVETEAPRGLDAVRLR